VESLTRNIYTHFSQSPLNTGRWLSLQQDLQIKPYKFILHPKTRWCVLENAVKRILKRYSKLQQYFENNDNEISQQLEQPETLVYFKLLGIFLSKINELLYSIQEFGPQITNISERIVDLFNFFINHVLQEEYRVLPIQKKMELLSYAQELDAVSINEKFTKNSIEFEVYLGYVYEQTIHLSSIKNDKTRANLSDNFKSFIVRAC